MVFSIITLSYDKISFVFDAIESILNQTFKDFEYLIVDSSIKHKEEIRNKVQMYNDSRIKLFYEPISDEDRNKVSIPSLLLNKYFDKMEGKYVIMLADDDVFNDRCLETHYEYHEKFPDRKAFYHGEILYVTETNKTMGIRFPGIIFDEVTSPDCVIDGGVVSHWRDCLKEIEKPWYPIDLTYKNHADGVFLTKLAKKFKIYPINEILGVHRFTPLSITSWGVK